MEASLHRYLEASQMIGKVQFEVLLIRKGLVDNHRVHQINAVIFVITPIIRNGYLVETVQNSELVIFNIYKHTYQRKLSSNHGIIPMKSIKQITAEKIFNLIIIWNLCKFHFLLVFWVNTYSGMAFGPQCLGRQFIAFMLFASRNSVFVSPWKTVDPLIYFLPFKIWEEVYWCQLMSQIVLIKIMLNPVRRLPFNLVKFTDIVQKYLSCENYYDSDDKDQS